MRGMGFEPMKALSHEVTYFPFRHLELSALKTQNLKPRAIARLGDPRLNKICCLEIKQMVNQM